MLELANFACAWRIAAATRPFVGAIGSTKGRSVGPICHTCQENVALADHRTAEIGAASTRGVFYAGATGNRTVTRMGMVTTDEDDDTWFAPPLASCDDGEDGRGQKCAAERGSLTANTRVESELRLARWQREHLEAVVCSRTWVSPTPVEVIRAPLRDGEDEDEEALRFERALRDAVRGEGRCVELNVGDRVYVSGTRRVAGSVAWLESRSTDEVTGEVAVRWVMCNTAARAATWLDDVLRGGATPGSRRRLSIAHAPDLATAPVERHRSAPH